MTTFLPADLSKKLKKLGCKSESEAAYMKEDGRWGLQDYSYSDDHYKTAFGIYEIVPAFSFEDVLRAENAKKIWGEKIGRLNYIATEGNALWERMPLWQYYRRRLLAIWDKGDDEWIELVREAVTNLEKNNGSTSL